MAIEIDNDREFSIEGALRTMLRTGIIIGRQEAKEEALWASDTLAQRLIRRSSGPIPVVLPECPDHKLPLLQAQKASPDGSWFFCPVCREERKSGRLLHMHNARNRALQKTHLLSVEQVELAETDTVIVEAVHIQKAS